MLLKAVPTPGSRGEHGKHQNTTCEQPRTNRGARLRDLRHGSHHSPFCGRIGMTTRVHHARHHVETGRDSSGIGERRGAGRLQKLRAHVPELKLQLTVARRKSCFRRALPEGVQEVLIPCISGHDTRDRDQGIVA